MSNLPVGTVTFFFSDIEGNTPLWERDPEAMDAAMQIHNAILRQAIEANDGAVVKIVGDEFQAVFSTAPQALAAAVEVQRGLLAATWNELGPLRVRMGIHTGEAHLDAHGDEYAVSHTKNRGHRVMEAGNGGQILLSQESADLCQRGLPPGLYLKDLGEHHIRNWKLPEHFYQVIAPGLPKDFPPLRTQAEPKHNLPVQLTSFIGRKKEIRQVENLLKKNRLVTLTGPGGTGKTRLALQVAAELLDRYPDGVWLVELSPLVDPGLVPQSVARALGMREATGPQTLSLLQDFLFSRRMLLILDNCEHLIEACALLADALLHACPYLHLLTSSREALGIEGEASFRIPPLTFPKVDQPLGNLTQYEAVHLFVERARSASSDFDLTSQNASAIARVCQRLDGIPLALELAAARLKMLSVEEIAQHLDDRFRLLTGGSRAALPRYQTLRASLDWSYDMLTPEERFLLKRLSVFAGGWTLEAAESVGCGKGIESCLVLDILGRLVNKSLVFIEAGTIHATRYRMLETIRQYSHEKLVESGGAEQARELHLRYFLELVQRMERKIIGPDQASILERLEDELDNIRLALGWVLEGRSRPNWNPEPGLHMAAALERFWHCRGRHAEGLNWLESLLLSQAEEDKHKTISLERIKARAHALLRAGTYASYIGKDTRVSEMLNESKALFAQLGEEGRLGYAWVLQQLGTEAVYHGDPQVAKELLDKSLVISTELKDWFGVGECNLLFGNIAFYNRNYAQAKVYFEESLRINKELGDKVSLSYRFSQLGIVAFYQGDTDGARALWEESRAMYPETNDVNTHCEVLLWLGILDWIEGNDELAGRYFDESLVISRQQGFVYGIVLAILCSGKMALSQGDAKQAALRFEENLTFNRKHEYTSYIAISLCALGDLAWTEGKIDQAARKYNEALALSHELDPLANFGLGKVALTQGDLKIARRFFNQVLNKIPYGNPFLRHEHIFEALAFVAISEQRMENATHLLGASEAWLQRIYRTRTLRERQERETAIVTVLQALGEEAFTKAWAEGESMEVEQTVAYALENHK